MNSFFTSGLTGNSPKMNIQYDSDLESYLNSVFRTFFDISGCKQEPEVDKVLSNMKFMII